MALPSARHFRPRYEKVRQAGRVLDCAVLIAIGVGLDGKRQVLGLSVALSEAEVHWRTFLQSLQARGLQGLQLLVSDDHAGLSAARRAVFPAVPWQRCQLPSAMRCAASPKSESH